MVTYLSLLVTTVVLMATLSARNEVCSLDINK